MNVHDAPCPPAADETPDGQRPPRPRHGRRRGGELRPSRHADGHGRRRDRALQPLPEDRPGRPRLARPRPLRALGRPRLDAALRRASPARLCRHGRSTRCSAFRQLGSATPGHPEYGHTLGVETTTGPLGQGIATAVGMALAERMLNARFGDDLVDHFTYVIAGDGCLMEGISHEAIDLAGHLRLGRLIVLWDDNRITIDGPTSLSTSTDQRAALRAPAAGTSRRVDGHDPEAVARRSTPRAADPRPSLIACRTVIGYGAPTKQGTARHPRRPARRRRDRRRPRRPRLDPPALRDAGGGPRRLGAPIAAPRRRARAPPGSAGSRPRPTRPPSRSRSGAGPVAELVAALAEHKRRLVADAPKVATRKASEMALEVRQRRLPDTVGGSADLTGSNNTRTKGMRAGHRRRLCRPLRPLRHPRARHGGGDERHRAARRPRPYGGTFLAFADYCRPAIRLSALMGLPVIYVMTHDSIGLGEDGPTHQPVEHLASLRAIPNLTVIRPADAVETAEAWEIALSATRTPTVLCLSRQNLPTVRTRPHRRQPDRPRRLRPPRARGPARRHAHRHRLRGRDRARGRRAPRRRRDRRGGGLDALLRALRGPGRGLPRRGPRRRRRASPSRRRSARAGSADRLRGRLRRHDRLRRLGAGGGPLRPLRHHRPRRSPTPRTRLVWR